MKRGFTLFKDSLDILDELTDDQAGKLFKAIRNFNRGKEVDLDPILKMCFLPFKNQFLREGLGLSEQEISDINKKNRNKRETTKSNESNESNESVHKSDSDSIVLSKSIVKVEVTEIVNYLNEKIKSSFSNKTPNTIKHITARLNEGRTIEDFKKVIDKKVAGWLGTEQAKYLRPETLFGSKFEGYLNELPTPEKKVKYEEIRFDENGEIILTKK